MQKFNKDGSIRKKPGRKPRAPVEHLTIFPSFTLRQASIVLHALEDLIPKVPDYIVDDAPVLAEELVEVCRALRRGFK